MKRIVTTTAMIALMSTGSTAWSADHGDTPFLIQEGRHDARLTDLFAFTRGSNLVLVVGMNPAIPNTLTSYQFPSDLRIVINIDSTSAVDLANDPEGLGGTILNPNHIRPDHKIRIQFDETGAPRVRGHDLTVGAFFAGLRDDPFIRAPRTGRNVSALVIEVPLADVTCHQSTILVWAEVDIEGEDQVELGARALRNQFPENDCLNGEHPRKHLQRCGLAPDVIIYDTSAPAAYPNGRELADDVVDLVGDARVLSNDQPFPTTNDVPFLSSFPYLAPPQP